MKTEKRTQRGKYQKISLETRERIIKAYEACNNVQHISKLMSINVTRLYVHPKMHQ